jgi:Ala-tRNA(Pro) deacylase
MDKVEIYLKDKQIEYKLHEHPAVFTCAEAEKHCSHIPGIASKNLFLRDQKKQRFFLVVMSAEKKPTLKKLPN